MFKYHCLNPISAVGMNKLDENYVKTENADEADVILVRSAKMHEMEFGKNLKAIARAGAGVNNIPLDKCAEEGIVVFNTPGANANGVKELVIAGMLLAARDVVGGIQWVQEFEEDGDIAKIAEKKKKAFAMITLSGTDDSYRHEITVILVKPKEDFSIRVTRQPKACEPDQPDKRKQPVYAETEHRKSLSQQDTATVYKVDEKKQAISFPNSQIKNYLEQTKDYNPIHEGENAIVPGFLILQKLLFELHFTDLLKENKIARVLMDHSCQDKEKEPEEGNREQCNEEQQISSEKKDFVIEMTWKDLLYCNEECTIYRSDAFTLCGKADRRILWICKVK